MTKVKAKTKTKAKVEDDGVVYTLSAKDKQALVNTSRVFFAMYDYTGMLEPWHDDPKYLEYKNTQVTVSDFARFLAGLDVDTESYAIIVNTLTFVNFSYLGFSQLYYNFAVNAWVKKLRNHCKTREHFKAVADFLLKFFTLQIEHKGKAFTSKGLLAMDMFSRSEKDQGKYAELLHLLADRIKRFKEESVDVDLWLETKFDKCKKAWDDHISLPAIIRINTIDPDPKLLIVANDAWLEIRKFLGVSLNCEFPDGYIPKGWGPASEDRDGLKDIQKILGSGYYYYADGTQRKGKRHYQGNNFLIIKSTPENFPKFKDRWNDVKMISAHPTWEEYKEFGINEFWDESGKSTSGRGPDVTWRKRS